MEDAPEVVWYDRTKKWPHPAAPKPEAAELVQYVRADLVRDAMMKAEAALADIGDADREPGDDLTWCERRAAQALPAIRAALAMTANA